MQFPCKDCGDRFVTETTTCHKTCEKYIAAQQMRTKESEYTKQMRARTYMYADYNRIERYKRRQLLDRKRRGI